MKNEARISSGEDDMLTFDEGSEELEYPKGIRAFKSQAEFVELDEITPECALGDYQISIILKAGSTRRHAMKICTGRLRNS